MHVGAPGERERVTRERGTTPIVVGTGGDADELDVRLRKQQRKGAEVVGIAADVGVEVDTDGHEVRRRRRLARRK